MTHVQASVVIVGFFRGDSILCPTHAAKYQPLQPAFEADLNGKSIQWTCPRCAPLGVVKMYTQETTLEALLIGNVRIGSRAPIDPFQGAVPCWQWNEAYWRVEMAFFRDYQRNIERH